MIESPKAVADPEVVGCTNGQPESAEQPLTTKVIASGEEKGCLLGDVYPTQFGHDYTVAGLNEECSIRVCNAGSWEEGQAVAEKFLRHAGKVYAGHCAFDPTSFGILTVPVPDGWTPLGPRSTPPMTVQFLTRETAVTIAREWNLMALQTWRSGNEWSFATHHTGGAKWNVIRVPVNDWVPTGILDFPPAIQLGSEIEGSAMAERNRQNRRRLIVASETGNPIRDWSIVVHRPDEITEGGAA